MYPVVPIGYGSTSQKQAGVVLTTGTKVLELMKFWYVPVSIWFWTANFTIRCEGGIKLGLSFWNRKGKSIHKSTDKIRDPRGATGNELYGTITKRTNFFVYWLKTAYRVPTLKWMSDDYSVSTRYRQPGLLCTPQNFAQSSKCLERKKKLLPRLPLRHF